VKYLPLLFLASAWPACSQFSGLSASGDGSVLYFSSRLRLRGSAQSQSRDAKLFRTRGQSPDLFLAQPRGYPIGWTNSEFYDLAAPQASRDGGMVAYTGARGCYGGSGCLTVQTAQGTVADAGGKPLLQATGYVNLSPNGQVAVFFARNTFGQMVSPSERVALDTGVRATLPYAIGAGARRRVADDGTVAALSAGAIHLWQPSADQTLSGPSASTGSGVGEPLLLMAADARRLVYQTAKGLARWDRQTSSEEILATGMPPSVSINDDASVVAYVHPTDGQVYLAAPTRRLGTAPEGFREVALSGDGRVAFAVTGQGRVLRIDFPSGGVTELVPRTPWITNSTFPSVEASLYDALTPGSLIPLVGSGLSASTAIVPNALPRTLGDVSVRIGGMDAAIQSISPEVVWVQVPWEVPEQEAAAFEYRSGNSPFESGPATVGVQARSPHPFVTSDPTNGSYIAAAHQDWSGLVTPTSPARGGEIVSLYFSGLGPVRPTVATGELAPAANPAQVTGPLRCQFWDGAPNDSQIYFAGLAPGMVGIYQVSLEVPLALRLSPVNVVCDFGIDAPGGFGLMYVAR